MFRKLLPLAYRWKTIGTLLDIPLVELNRIQRDEVGIEDCLRVMLSEWLEQADPAPRWEDIADAVDAVDKLKAEEIRNQCVDVPSDSTLAYWNAHMLVIRLVCSASFIELHFVL